MFKIINLLGPAFHLTFLLNLDMLRSLKCVGLSFYIQIEMNAEILIYGLPLLKSKHMLSSFNSFVVCIGYFELFYCWFGASTLGKWTYLCCKMATYYACCTPKCLWYWKLFMPSYFLENNEKNVSNSKMISNQWTELNSCCIMQHTTQF